jgi:hypothetical protein
VCNELVLVRVCSWQGVVEQRCGTTAVEEVDTDSLAVTVGCGQSTSEVRSKVDCGTVDVSSGENTWHGVHGCRGSGVVSDDHGVDQQLEKSVLVLSCVAHKQGRSAEKVSTAKWLLVEVILVVADGRIGRTLRGNKASNSCNGSNKLHDEKVRR